MAVNIMNLPKVIGVVHGIEPVWASDAGRNSNSGRFSGTFVGWFDTLEVSVGSTNQNEMTQIRNAIEKPIINVSYIDSKTGNVRTADFYGTVIQAPVRNIHKNYDAFSFNLKAVSRR